MSSLHYRIRRLVEELQAKAVRLGIPASAVGDYSVGDVERALGVPFKPHRYGALHFHIGARDPVEAPRIVYRGRYRGQVVVDPIGIITAYPVKQEGRGG